MEKSRGNVRSSQPCLPSLEGGGGSGQASASEGWSALLQPSLCREEAADSDRRWEPSLSLSPASPYPAPILQHQQQRMSSSPQNWQNPKEKGV